MAVPGGPVTAGCATGARGHRRPGPGRDDHLDPLGGVRRTARESSGASRPSSRRPDRGARPAGPGIALVGYSLRLGAAGPAPASGCSRRSGPPVRRRSGPRAPAERARTARELHDVLAPSLSAPMVHLEAARIRIEQGADRAWILERVVAVRGRPAGAGGGPPAPPCRVGEVVPVEAFLRDSAAPRRTRRSTRPGSAGRCPPRPRGRSGGWRRKR
ncbi:histidine kinase dimerization/phosphoacceptor domain-containing protein [Streptomyces sp. Wb2n-11]|uniref:histidine kinase dimerization/phosphoacceptor domain-containing protein n=1 Tax=Streptomyces sp. Wb2n-11 TaxID=1030533 RepID=UPI00350E4299